MRVNRYAGKFPMEPFIKEAWQTLCVIEKHNVWYKKKYAIHFGSMQLMIVRLCKYKLT